MKKNLLFYCLLLLALGFSTATAQTVTLPLTVTIPETVGPIHLESAVPVEITGSVISKGFEYRSKGFGDWTTISAPDAFEANITSLPNGNYEIRAFAEVSGQGMFYSRTNQVTKMCNCNNNNAGIEYPIEIPFTEYSVIWGTALLPSFPSPCKWSNFELFKVIVINSNEELQNYIVCTAGNYPEIDFSTHSLLLARGVASYGIENIDINLLKETAHKYTLNVSIFTNLTTQVPPWLLSIITPKINNEATITLNVHQSP